MQFSVRPQILKYTYTNCKYIKAYNRKPRPKSAGEKIK